MHSSKLVFLLSARSPLPLSEPLRSEDVKSLPGGGGGGGESGGGGGGQWGEVTNG